MGRDRPKLVGVWFSQELILFAKKIQLVFSDLIFVGSSLFSQVQTALVGVSSVENVKQFIASHGYSFEPEIDGEYHEFKTDQGKGWYIGEALGDKVSFTFGDWVTSQRFHFKAGFSEEDSEFLDIQKEHIRQANEERELRVKQECAKDFESLESIGISPYLNKKKIGSLLGCKTRASSFGTTDLIIPMMDEKGEIWNLQKIQENGFKAYSPGGRTKGVFYVIGEIKDAIYITEGFATGASVHYATKAGVVVAFSASNLEAVAKTMRLKYPTLPIIIAADDDYQKSPNAGKDAGHQAAAIAAGTVCFPDFGKNRGDEDTDWNDLHKAKGLNEVTKQFAKHQASPPPEGFKPSQESPTKEKVKSNVKALKRLHISDHLKPWINGLAPLPEKFNEKGMIILPSEFEVASELLKYYEGKILKQNEDIFQYIGTHWKLSEPQDLDRLKIQIQVLYAGLARNALLESTFAHFTKLIPSSPRDLFISNPYRANFLNGTLHIIDSSLKFLPHSPLDFCTHVIPIEYDTTRKVRNEEFENMLNRIIGEVPEKADKLRAIRQMYGACIAPISPKLFLLHGLGGRGKSSVIIPAQRLVHKDNWSSVEPKDFKGFNMESMVGKLVNFVSDIDTTEPIDDANIKKIWDRMPIRIDRKFKTPLHAPLPAVHIFAGNDIPSTYEKSSGAHTRRWIFIEINNYQIGEAYILNFANKAFDAGPQGVLNFALDGLEDLLKEDGKFHSPDSSKEKIKDWELKHDPVGLFLKEVGEGDVEGLKLEDEGRVERKLLWEKFSEWYEASFHKKPRMGKIIFFESLRGKGLGQSKHVGVHYFKGICVSVGASDNPPHKF